MKTILQLQSTKNQIEGWKRKLNEYNVFLSCWFDQFEDLDKNEKRDLVCDLNVHCASDYVTSDLDSTKTKPFTNNNAIVTLASWRWRCTSDEIK